MRTWLLQRIIRMCLLLSASALICGGATAAAGCAASKAKNVSARRVEVVFAHAGFSVFPPAADFGQYQVVLAIQSGRPWPSVSILVFKQPFQAARLFAYHEHHPDEPLVRDATHPGKQQAVRK